MVGRISFIILFLTALPAAALEVQGFITNDCRHHVGIVVHASGDTVETIGLDGNFHSFPAVSINAVYVFNLITNPFSKFNVDAAALNRLKRVYVHDDDDHGTLAFPVRFIEDLIIFYSLEGKSHVYRMADIFKLRPAPATAAAIHTSPGGLNPGFEFSDQAAVCPLPLKSGSRPIKPTRVLADKISIAEFFSSFEQGYERLESFQERTYLYAKPLLFEPSNRLGLIFSGKREEINLVDLPVYFQWTTGEPYRFQSYNVVGQKSHEFTPNTESLLSLRSDVKSHAFHAMFVGNAASLSAGDSVYLDGGGLAKLEKKDISVQNSFNYMALMGGDYGPYSVSGGFYFPSFAFKVGEDYREVLASKASYALRFMYTKRDLRARIIGSLTEYQNGKAKEDQVLSKAPNEMDNTVNSFKFESKFLRAGIDYQFTREFSASLDGIYIGGSYRELNGYISPATIASNLKFEKVTVQLMLRQSFGHYVALSAFVNFADNKIDSRFQNTEIDRHRRETRYFGSLEFIF